jgi:hypothetical protein
MQLSTAFRGRTLSVVTSDFNEVMHFSPAASDQSFGPCQESSNSRAQAGVELRRGGDLPSDWQRTDWQPSPRLNCAHLRQEPVVPLRRLRTGALTANRMNHIYAWRMIQRRAAELGLRAKIGCHTFRATGIAAYLEAGGTLENAQTMAAHESPRTTKLYDRTGDGITLDEVERITI